MPVGAVAQARLFVVGMEHIMRKPLPNAPPGSRFAGIAAHAPPVGLPAMPVLFKKLVSKVSCASLIRSALRWKSRRHCLVVLCQTLCDDSRLLFQGRIDHGQTDAI